VETLLKEYTAGQIKEGAKIWLMLNISLLKWKSGLYIGGKN